MNNTVFSNHDFYFWYDADYKTLYIDPVTTSMKLPIFDEKISQAILIIPTDTDKYPVIDGRNSIPIEETIYSDILKMTFGEFFNLPWTLPCRALYEYSFQLSSGRTVDNLGLGLCMRNTTISFVNESINSILQSKINLDEFEPERFYQVEDRIVKRTTHVTKDAIDYVASLKLPELYE
jgi:hypothetical protein